jgi:hypothetical protein
MNRVSGVIAYTRRRDKQPNQLAMVRVFFRTADGARRGTVAMTEDAAAQIKPNVPYTIDDPGGLFAFAHAETPRL